ncbi:MAG TPA: GNAT family N-acetyltransferase [Gaiellaceae bacterium]|nr:GNAT family N-acetyltransferase [Gaiellaceae bacterium]
MTELRTPRLLLRQWRDDDLEPFAALNADPEVMRHFPTTLTRGESDALASGQRALIAERGWGLWAVEALAEAPFIGFVGLAESRFAARFTPVLEIGWGLSREHWGRGYATEGARAAITFGFDELGLDEIAAFTASVNDRSRSVMKRLGMTHSTADDFEHPGIGEGDPLRPYVMYRARAFDLERT